MFFLLFIVALTIAVPLTVDHARNPARSQIVLAKAEAVEFTRDAIVRLQTKVKVRSQKKFLNLFVSLLAALYLHARDWLKATGSRGAGGSNYR